jgi:hypothetical protein
MYADLLLERRIFGSFEVVVLSMIDLSALHDFGGCAMLGLCTYVRQERIFLGFAPAQR